MQVTDTQIDSLKEIINIGVGKGAEVLNTMVSSHISLSTPLIKLIKPIELIKELSSLGGDKLSSVNLGFHGPFAGVARIIFPTESAQKLVSIFAGEDDSFGDDFDSLRAGALSEIGNIVLNSIMGSISNLLNLNLLYSVPSYIETEAKNILTAEESSDLFSVIVLAQTRFVISSLSIIGDIILYLEMGSFEALMRSVDIFNESNLFAN